MGIYWVYFKAKGGHELMIQVDAKSRELAVKEAEGKANGMGFGWKYDRARACR